MIYLSAQPDQIYFIWQLEIQLRNFNQLGIEKENIHVIFAYNSYHGLNPAVNDFIKNNAHLAAFFSYPDCRKKSNYKSTIRPHVLKQHFAKNPKLESSTIFYHDSDILLSRIPNIDDVEFNDICYVSDTSNYLDCNYLRSVVSEEFLDEMLKTVGLRKDVLDRFDKNTGGAQYIVKGIDFDFWSKIENDSENLYNLMTQYNEKQWAEKYKERKNLRSKHHGIQAWCSDMWALLWNLWAMGKKVEIHPEMDFSWPYSPIEDWSRFAIQHYSGNVENKDLHFKKTEYDNYFPWYDNSLNNIPDTNCSYEIVKAIKSRRLELDQTRTIYLKRMILFYTEKIDENAVRNYFIYKSFVLKNIKIDLGLLSKEVPKENTYDIDVFFTETFESSDFKDYRIVIIPLQYIISIDQLEKILISEEQFSHFKSYSSYSLDLLFTEAFSKILDFNLLEENKGKFSQSITQVPIVVCTAINWDKTLTWKRFNNYTRVKILPEIYVLP